MPLFERLPRDRETGAEFFSVTKLAATADPNCGYFLTTLILCWM